MTRCLPAIALAAALLAGCDATDTTTPQTQRAQAPSQPLPTVDADGSLSIPADYAPGPKIDTARVDCAQYLATTPADIRDEARRLCAASTTPAERERNPYCEIERVTAACISGGPQAAP